ncbi:diguanylate cyclase [Alkalilimnicola ehrlichii MLHE-1]|uniref:Diguanylate cyclase with PAS/PAC and GAF sensors n=1 Tax=Alkalilimnicola ehrlichii (strain ATCC BAA-1101 / DSM 17681 / MLHE-1) TaxID=187272 RepID=Q0A872_ALKEH|nr:sensor domain-containing diguanylate cyclase [Alkalilimnicola ehrlichii]ABI56965.1 diguanylate cyclase with PAS/PAC and GAF sensors [Alkalilimnicola ehrlichii MLHE-1]
MASTLLVIGLIATVRFRARHDAGRDVGNQPQALPDEPALFQRLAGNTSAGLFLARADRLIAVNPALCRILRCPPEQLTGAEWRPLIHSDHADEVETHVSARLRGQPASPLHPIRVQRGDGTTRWVELSLEPVALGGDPAMVGTLVDIDRHCALQQELLLSERKYRQLVENVNDIIYTLTPDGRLSYVSPNWPELLGHPVDQVIGRPIARFVHPDDLPGCEEFLRRLFLTGKKQSGIEYRVRHSDGHWRWHTANASPITGDDGTVIAFVGIARDITARKGMEAELVYQLRFNELVAELSTRFVRSPAEETDARIDDLLRRAGTLFNADRAYLYLFSDDGETMSNTHEWCAPAVPSLLEDSQRMPVARYPWWQRHMTALRDQHQVLFINDVSALPAEAAAERALLEGQQVRTLVCAPVATPDRVIGFLGFDSLRPKEWRKDQGDLLVVLGNLLAAALVRRQLELDLRNLSVTDPLTGLFNRRFLRARLLALIEEYERHGHRFCVSLVDLDHFKALNDRHGHLAGDRILQGFANILRDNHRVFDIVARYGGEEFVVILVGTEIGQARRVTRRALTTTRNHDFRFNETPLSITASAGLADIAELPEDHRTVEHLLQLADHRLYRAKQQGRDCLVAD